MTKEREKRISEVLGYRLNLLRNALERIECAEKVKYGEDTRFSVLEFSLLRTCKDDLIKTIQQVERRIAMLK